VHEGEPETGAIVPGTQGVQTGAGRNKEPPRIVSAPLVKVPSGQMVRKAPGRVDTAGGDSRYHPKNSTEGGSTSTPEKTGAGA